MRQYFVGQQQFNESDAVPARWINVGTQQVADVGIGVTIDGLLAAVQFAAASPSAQTSGGATVSLSLASIAFAAEPPSWEQSSVAMTPGVAALRAAAAAPEFTLSSVAMTPGVAQMQMRGSAPMLAWVRSLSAAEVLFMTAAPGWGFFTTINISAATMLCEATFPVRIHYVTPTAACAVGRTVSPRSALQKWPAVATVVTGTRGPLVIVSRAPIPPGNQPPTGSLPEALRDQWEPVWLVDLNVLT